MFKIDTTKKTTTEFNTNRLTVKISKSTLIDKPIQPKDQKISCQNISPVEDCSGNINEALFEIY